MFQGQKHLQICKFKPKKSKANIKKYICKNKFLEKAWMNKGEKCLLKQLSAHHYEPKYHTIKAQATCQ